MKRICAALLGVVLLAGCQSDKPKRIMAVDHFPAASAVVQLSVSDARTAIRDMKGSEATIRKFMEPALADARITTNADAPLTLTVDVIDYDLLPNPDHAQLTARVTVRREREVLFDRVFRQSENLAKDSLGIDKSKVRPMAFDMAAEKLAAQIVSNDDLQKAVGKGQ
jgi:hypothetical protein